MLDLPKSTYVGKIIAKDKIYSHSGADTELKELFVGQVERIRWLNKISPSTINIAQGEQVDEIQIIELTTTADLDKRILQAVRKAIPYKIVFVLIGGGKTVYTVCYDSKIWFSSEIPPKLIGNDTDSIWKNIIVLIGGIVIEKGKTLDEQITADEEREKLKRAIERLEKQARSEKQPRRKWALAEEVKKLKGELT